MKDLPCKLIRTRVLSPLNRFRRSQRHSKAGGTTRQQLSRRWMEDGEGESRMHRSVKVCHLKIVLLRAVWTVASHKTGGSKQRTLTPSNSNCNGGQGW